MDRMLVKIALFAEDSARRCLIRELFDMVARFAQGHKGCSGYIMAPSGVGKTELVDAFVYEIPNFFPNVECLLLDAACQELPQISTYVSTGKKLLVVIDNMEILYSHEQHKHVVLQIAGIINARTDPKIVVIGIGSSLKLRRLLLMDTSVKEEFTNVGKVPKLNGGKFPMFANHLHNAVSEEQFQMLVEHIAPDYYHSLLPQDLATRLAKLMWITGGNPRALSQILAPKEDDSTYSLNPVQRVCNVVSNLLERSAQLDQGEQRALKQMMKKIIRRNYSIDLRQVVKFGGCGLCLDPGPLVFWYGPNPLSPYLRPVPMGQHPDLDALCYKGLLVYGPGGYYAAAPLLVPAFLLRRPSIPTVLDALKDKFMFLAPSAGHAVGLLL